MKKDVSTFSTIKEDKTIVEGKTRQDNGAWFVKDFNFYRFENEKARNCSHYCKIDFINPITKVKKICSFEIDLDNYNVKSAFESIINSLNYIKDDTFWVEYDVKEVKENK